MLQELTFLEFVRRVKCEIYIEHLQNNTTESHSHVLDFSFNQREMKCRNVPLTPEKTDDEKE